MINISLTIHQPASMNSDIIMKSWGLVTKFSMRFRLKVLRILFQGFKPVALKIRIVYNLSESLKKH